MSQILKVTKYFEVLSKTTKLVCHRSRKFYILAIKANRKQNMLATHCPPALISMTTHTFPASSCRYKTEASALGWVRPESESGPCHSLTTISGKLLNFQVTSLSFGFSSWKCSNHPPQRLLWGFLRWHEEGTYDRVSAPCSQCSSQTPSEVNPH